jgi:hypothetical protein
MPRPAEVLLWLAMLTIPRAVPKWQLSRGVGDVAGGRESVQTPCRGRSKQARPQPQPQQLPWEKISTLEPASALRYE